MKKQTTNDIQATDQVAEIIITHPQLLKSVLRMGISPALGNTTLAEACSGKSMELELCLEILRISSDPNYKPQTLSRYALLPLVEFYSSSISALRPWFDILGKHLHSLESLQEGLGYSAVIKFFDIYKERVERFISQQEEQLKDTITHLYELFYSPVITEEDLELINKGLLLTNKEEGDIPSNEIGDIYSLLLRHTKVPENQLMYCGTMLQVSDLKYSLECINNIRAKLLYPMVADMARQIRKRKPETEG